MKLRINAQAENRVKSKTIYYRIFTYFAAFSVVILITLWLLQIFFLQTFYQWMKSSELYSLADTIEEGVGNESLYDTISHLTVKSDMYIEIERGDSGVIYGTAQSLPSERMAQFAQRYNTSALKAKLLTEDVDHVVTKQTINPGNTETMIYASILGTDSETGELIYLFIFSPLTPVGTTISILAKMLVIVTILSIFIGLVMSIVISRRLAQPLYSITDSAAQLAKGHYDIKFEGAGYAETEDLADTLNYAAAELSKSDKLQKDLVANVSHDLKTPLTMVKSYAEMIRDLSGDNPEKRNRHLQVIINEADRLNMLVNDLTSLSKMQAGVDEVLDRKFEKGSLTYQKFDSIAKAAQDTILANMVNMLNRMKVIDDGVYARLQNYKHDDIPDDIQIQQLELYNKNIAAVKEKRNQNEGLIYKLDELRIELAASEAVDAAGIKAYAEIDTLIKQIEYYQN